MCKKQRDRLLQLNYIMVKNLFIHRMRVSSMAFGLLAVMGLAWLGVPLQSRAAVLGDQKTLVVLIKFQGDPAETDIKAQVRDTVFNRIASYYREISYGKVNLVGDVVGWYTLPMAPTCPVYGIVPPEALKAASAVVNIADYSRLILVSPWLNCGGVSGMSTEGKTGIFVDGKMYMMSVSTVDKWRVGAGADIFALAHELLHGFGLGHAGVWNIDDRGGLDPLGSSLVFLNVPHAEMLGWFNPSNMVTVSSSGRYTIEPMATRTNGVKILKLRRRPAREVIPGTNYFYVEFRAPVGADTSIGRMGALMNIRSGLTGLGTLAVIVHPPSGLTLLPGETYTETTSGTSITVVSADASGLTVDITLGANGAPVDATAPTVAMVAPASGSTVSGTVDVTVNSSESGYFYYKLDNYNLLAEESILNPLVHWNTLTVANGPHTITPFARDFYGNLAEGSPITVIVNNPDPTIGPWLSTTSLPSPRYQHSSAFANGYVYVMGGLDASTNLAKNTVFVSKINADNSLGPWSNTTPLPRPTTLHSSVVANGYIYIIGGQESFFGSVVYRDIYYAKLNADGTLGSWSLSNNPLPDFRTDHTSVVANGYLYVIGGSNSTGAGGVQSTIYYAKLNADGSLGPWTLNATRLQISISKHASVVANGYLYVSGGEDINSEEIRPVYYAKLNADGSTGPWLANPFNPPPELHAHTAQTANGYLYLIGDNVDLVVYHAKLNADGTTGPWSNNRYDLPRASEDHTSILTNSHLYVLGGYDGVTFTPATAVVYGPLATFLPAPTPTVILTATPVSIAAGSSTTLNWSSTNATSCSAPWTSSTAISGSQNITPTVTTIYTMTCTGTGGNATQSVTVGVIAPPVLNSIGNQVIDEGGSLNIQVSGSDFDGDVLVYSVSGLPVGATFNPATQVFVWTPTYEQAGVYLVTFTVSNSGGLTDAEDVTITVTNVNRPPILNHIGDKTVSEGQFLSFVVSGSDPDVDSLTYSTTNMPSGASFNSVTHTFSWTPSTGQAGTYSGVMFQVSDGALMASQAITITVIADKTAPSLVITAPAVGSTVPEIGFAFTGTVSDVSGVSEVRVYVYDYGRSVFTVSNALASHNAATQAWNFVVLASHLSPGRQALLYVRAKDAVGNWTGFLTRTVMVNAPPGTDITPPTVTITAPASGAIVLKTGFAFTGGVTDPSGIAEVRIYVYDYGRSVNTVNNQLAVYNAVTSAWTFNVLSTQITPGKNALLYVRAKDTKSNWSTWLFRIVTVSP